MQSKRSLRGQTSVEFALTIVFVMLFIIGGIEVIVLIYTYNVLADAAKDGVRYAIVHGTDSGANCSGPGSSKVTCGDSTGANVTAEVKNFAILSLHDPSAMTITPTYPDASSAPPSRVRVEISYQYQTLFGLGWPTVTLNAAAEGRIAF